MAGFDPNQPRDEIGRWTKAETAARKAAGLSNPVTPESVWDKEGMGSVPLQREETEYYGRTRWMTPTEFLSLVPEIPGGSYSADIIKDKLLAGEKMAPPFLDVAWTGDSWKVLSHEGRNRTIAFYELFGDLPMPVYLLFNGRMRARDVSDEMLERPMIRQEGSSKW